MIIDEIFSNNKINSVFFKKFKETNDWLNIKNNYNENFIDTEIVYLHINKQFEKPKCYCGKSLIFKTYTKGYSQYCSSYCSNHSINKFNKTKNTKMKKYGKSSYNNIEKRKKTNLKKYNVEHGFQDKNIQNKIKDTLIKNYGVENSSQIDFVKEKRKIIKPDRTNFLITLDKKRKSNTIYNNLSNKKWFENEYKEKTIVKISEELKVAYSTVNNYRLKHNISLNWLNKSFYEKEIENFLKEFNIQYILNDRTIISPKEIDIYLPDHNLGIEINGLYWHSSISKENENKYKNYHMNKSNECKEKNIQLLQFTDYEFDNKQDIIKSMIKSKLNLSNKIFARKCEIKNISSKLGKNFVNENHIQGSCNGGYYKALYYKNDILAVMQIGKSRYNKNIEFELLRFCSKLNYNVIGGFSKLLKSFNITSSIISYANRNYSNGNVYEKNNFILINETIPNYFYWNDKEYFPHSRLKFQKHKLSKIFENYDEKLSESENMYNNNWKKYFDSGQLVYIKNYNK